MKKYKNITAYRPSQVFEILQDIGFTKLDDNINGLYCDHRWEANLWNRAFLRVDIALPDDCLEDDKWLEEDATAFVACYVIADSPESYGLVHLPPSLTVMGALVAACQAAQEGGVF